MVPVGGVGAMVAGAAIATVIALGLAMLLKRWVGPVTAIAIAGLWCSVVVIALVTLLPATGSPGIVPADSHATTCSTDIGGPAPDGFWIFAGGQRLLNAALFVPSAALLVLASARWRIGWALAPFGLLMLAGYSVAIEYLQLELARLDRACDLTDVIDNVAGLAIGAGVGVVLALVFRPWRGRAVTVAR